MKAKKVNTFHGEHFTTVEYEYRGHTYEVEYANDWTCCATPAHIQHRDKQAEIDRRVELERKKQPENPFDLEKIFSLLGWDD